MFVMWEYKARERMADPRKPRIILITKRLGKLLLRLRCRADSLDGPVFRNANGDAWTSNAVRCRVRRLRAKLQVDGGENIVAYTLRHTAATYASTILTQAELKEWLGHTSLEMTQRYQHLQIDHLHGAMKKIEQRKKAG
jgi:integrase